MIGIEKVTVLPRADGESAVEVVFVDDQGTKTTLTFVGRVRSSFTLDHQFLNVALRLVPPSGEASKELLMPNPFEP